MSLLLCKNKEEGQILNKKKIGDKNKSIIHRGKKYGTVKRQYKKKIKITGTAF